MGTNFQLLVSFLFLLFSIHISTGQKHYHVVLNTRFAVLEDVSPFEVARESVSSCTSSFLDVPRGWRIADDDQSARLAISSTFFGTRCLVLMNDVAYETGTLFRCPGSQFIVNSTGHAPSRSLTDGRSNGPFRVNPTHCRTHGLRILISQPARDGDMDSTRFAGWPHVSNFFTLFGNDYAALDNSPLFDKFDGTLNERTCQGGGAGTVPGQAMQLPTGWSLAEDDIFTRIAFNGAGPTATTTCIVLSSGNSYRAPDRSVSCGSRQLVNISGDLGLFYKPLLCARKVIISRRSSRADSWNYDINLTHRYLLSASPSEPEMEIATLDNTPFGDQANDGCQSVSVRLPNGWQLAPDSSQIRRYLAKHKTVGTFGSSCLVLSSGRSIALPISGRNCFPSNDSLVLRTPNNGTFIAARNCFERILVSRLIKKAKVEDERVLVVGRGLHQGEQATPEPTDAPTPFSSLPPQPTFNDHPTPFKTPPATELPTAPTPQPTPFIPNGGGLGPLTNLLPPASDPTHTDTFDDNSAISFAAQTGPGRSLSMAGLGVNQFGCSVTSEGFCANPSYPYNGQLKGLFPRVVTSTPTTQTILGAVTAVKYVNGPSVGPNKILACPFRVSIIGTFFVPAVIGNVASPGSFVTTGLAYGSEQYFYSFQEISATQRQTLYYRNTQPFSTPYTTLTLSSASPVSTCPTISGATFKCASDVSFAVADGMIFLRGHLTDVTASSVILTIPSQYAPSEELSFVSVGDSGSAVIVVVKSNGELSSMSSSNFLSLDAVSYYYIKTTSNPSLNHFFRSLWRGISGLSATPDTAELSSTSFAYVGNFFSGSGAPLAIAIHKPTVPRSCSDRELYLPAVLNGMPAVVQHKINSSFISFQLISTLPTLSSNFVRLFAAQGAVPSNDVELIIQKGSATFMNAYLKSSSGFFPVNVVNGLPFSHRLTSSGELQVAQQSGWETDASATVALSPFGEMLFVTIHQSSLFNSGATIGILLEFSGPVYSPSSGVFSYYYS